MDSSRPLVEEALTRGVVLRTLFQDSFRNDPATLDYIRWLASVGGETCTVPSLPMMLIIVDNEFALVPIDTADPSRGALEVRSRGVVAALHALFMKFWVNGLPWPEPDAPDSTGLSRRERETLYMLASGSTDEAISTKLGLSLRTVRRTVAQLMGRLGARSRFEAGLLAAARAG